MAKRLEEQPKELKGSETVDEPQVSNEAPVKPKRRVPRRNPSFPTHRTRKNINNDNGERQQRSDKWSPDEEQLASLHAMAGLGLNMAQIAHIVGVHPASFFRSLRQQPEIRAAIESGRATATMNVSRAAYEMAISKKVPDITKFWLKARAGWRDAQAIEIGRGRDYETYSDQDLEAEICQQEKLLELMEPVEGENDALRLLGRTVYGK